jgi:hypothetical protein
VRSIHASSLGVWEGAAVDPGTFDGLIRRLSRSLSRRSLVGGSLGASLLTAVGLGDATLAEKAKTERCVPPGRRCGTKKNDPPCRQCCHRYHILVGKRKKKCACRPAGTDCSNASQCCTGICDNGTCRSAPCRAVGIRCAFNTDCCTGICTCSFATDCTCRAAGAVGSLVTSVSTARTAVPKFAKSFLRLDSGVASPDQRISRPVRTAVPSRLLVI